MTWISEVPNDWFLGMTIGVATYLLYRFLVFGEEGSRLPRLICRVTNSIRLGRKFIFAIIYVASIVMILFLPSLHDVLSINYVQWTELQIYDWLRLLATFLLTTFLPGSAILRLLSKKREFNVTEHLVFSYVFSVFFTFLVSYSLIILGFGLVKYAVHSIIGANVVFLALVILKPLREMSSKRSHSPSCSTKRAGKSASHKVRCSVLLFLCMIAFVAFFMHSVLPDFPYIFSEDYWRYLGLSMHIVKAEGPKFMVGLNGEMLSAYFPLFHIFLASFVILSQLPVINATLILYSFYMMPILSFYLMASSLYKKNSERKALLATVFWFFFSGFTWLVVAFCKLTGNQTGWDSLIFSLARGNLGDITYNFNHLIFGNSPMTISLTCFFATFYLTRRKTFDRKCLVLTSVAFFVGYLAHIFEMLLFVILYLPILFLLNQNDTERLEKISKSILITMAFLVLAELIAFGTLTRSIYMALAGLYILSLIFFSYVRRRLKVKLRLSGGKVRNNIIKFGMILTLYLWFLSFIIWAYIYPDFQYPLYPVYYLPLGSGVAGFIMVIGLIYHNLRTNTKEKFGNGTKIFLFSIPLLLLLGESMRFLLAMESYITYTYPWMRQRLGVLVYFGGPSKVRLYLGIAVSIIAAFFTSQAFKKIRSRIGHLRTRAFAAFLLTLIVILGIGSTVLSTDLWSMIGETYKTKYQRFSQEEFEALDYLCRNLARDENILTLTEISQANLNHFISTTQNFKERELVFTSKEPEFVFSILSALNIKYVYMASRDRDTLKNEAFAEGFISRLIPHLPIVFNNSEVTLYDVPSFSPSTASSFSTVYSPYAYYPFSMLGLSGISYSIYLPEDRTLFQSTTIMLPADFPEYVLKLEPNMSFFDEFQNYTSGSDGRPRWEPLSGSWRVEGEAYIEDTVSYAAETFMPENYSDFVMMVDIVSTTAESKFGGGVVFRWQDASNYYLFAIRKEGNTAFYVVKAGEIIKKVFGPSVNPLEKHTLRVVCKEEWINIYIDGNLNIDVIDETFAGGRLGLTNRKAVTHFDDVKVWRYKRLLNLEQASEYLEWIEGGGHLIVLNSLGRGIFAHVLSLETNETVRANSIRGIAASVSMPEFHLPILTSRDPNVEIIANYTYNYRKVSDFGLSKKIGDGQITFVNIYPYFQVLQNTSKHDVSQQLFLGLREIPKVLDLSFPMSSNGPHQHFEVANENVTCNGEVKIEFSEALIRQNVTLCADVLTLKNDTVDRTIRNAKIKNIRIVGTPASTITTCRAQLTSSIATYSSVKLTEPFNWTLVVPENCSVDIEILDEKIQDVSLREGVLRLLKANKSSSSSILIKQPLVTNHGETIFDEFPFRKAFIDLDFNKGIIKGEVGFWISSTSEKMMLLNGFHYDGVLLKSTTDYLFGDGVAAWLLEWSIIPWSEISSPIHTFLTIVILGFCLVLLRGRA